MIINTSDFQMWKCHTCCRVWGRLCCCDCVCVCAWPCVCRLEGQRSGSSLFSLFVDKAATAGLRHFAEIYSRDLYWWGVKKPWYRTCIHQRVSSFCLLQSKPSGFSWREATSEWRPCPGKNKKSQLSWVCVLGSFVDWCCHMRFMGMASDSPVVLVSSPWLAQVIMLLFGESSLGVTRINLTWCCGPVKGGADDCWFSVEQVWGVSGFKKPLV